MRWLLTFLFMLLAVPASAQNNTTLAPWNTYTWPHTAPEGYCLLHQCYIHSMTQIPAFTIDGGISLTGTGDIATRRTAMINSVWGSSHLPTAIPDMRLNTRLWSGCETGNHSAASAIGFWNGAAAPNDLNGPPEFQNFAGTDGACVDLTFITPSSLNQHQLIWIYKPVISNKRMILIMCGHNMRSAGQAGVANVVRSQIAMGLRQEFTVAVVCMPAAGDVHSHTSIMLGTATSPATALVPNNGSNAGLRAFFQGELEIINYYSQHGIIDFAMTGNSGGGWNSCNYPALDPRVKVTWANNGCFLGTCYGRDIALSNQWSHPGNIDTLGVTGRCSDAEQWWPWWYSLSTFFDDFIMASADNAGARKFTVSTSEGDFDVSPHSWLNADRNANGAAWNNNPRCNASGPCTWTTRRAAVTAAIKTSGLIPADNFGGSENDPVGPEFPGPSAHSQSSWSRMRYMADFQELGSKAQMSHGHIP
jgi:hypothetical protein